VVAGDLTTAMIDLDAGPVEYRLDRRGPACVLWCHRAPATAVPRCAPADHRPRC
jgi:hypothetical protein